MRALNSMVLRLSMVRVRNDTSCMFQMCSTALVSYNKLFYPFSACKLPSSSSLYISASGPISGHGEVITLRNPCVPCIQAAGFARSCATGRSFSTVPVTKVLRLIDLSAVTPTTAPDSSYCCTLTRSRSRTHRWYPREKNSVARPSWLWWIRLWLRTPNPQWIPCTPTMTLLAW